MVKGNPVVVGFIVVVVAPAAVVDGLTSYVTVIDGCIFGGSFANGVRSPP